jgi:hypothetical protein
MIGGGEPDGPAARPDLSSGVPANDAVRRHQQTAHVLVFENQRGRSLQLTP